MSQNVAPPKDQVDAQRLKAQEMHKSAWRHAIGQGEADPGSDIPYTAGVAGQVAEDAKRSVGSSDPIDPDVF